MSLELIGVLLWLGLLVLAAVVLKLGERIDGGDPWYLTAATVVWTVMGSVVQVVVGFVVLSVFAVIAVSAFALGMVALGF